VSSLAFVKELAVTHGSSISNRREILCVWLLASANTKGKGRDQFIFAFDLGGQLKQRRPYTDGKTGRGVTGLGARCGRVRDPDGVRADCAPNRSGASDVKDIMHTVNTASPGDTCWLAS
jgi:hypothetical protein